MIQANNLKKIYNPGKTEVRALNNISFKIQKGEFVGIMGASGSGKSTLLHQLGLLDMPTSGEILINNINVLTLSENKRTAFRLKELGYVFQEYAILPELTAIENVYLPAIAAGKSDYIKEAQKLLKTVGLNARADHLPSELSGGEQQRVAIARALINKPKILFADEPCANLDSKSSKHIMELFKKLNIEMEQTIVMVTHEDWHKEYIDRIILMNDGIIENE